VSVWRKALLSLIGKGGLPSDPRYRNKPAREVTIETSESHYTIDGEVVPSAGTRFDVGLGPSLNLATLGAKRRRLARPRTPAPPIP
jgi:hypothetical protein